MIGPHSLQVLPVADGARVARPIAPTAGGGRAEVQIADEQAGWARKQVLFIFVVHLLLC